MIEKTHSYITSDGSIHATMEAAQEWEILLLSDDEDFTKDEWPKWIVANREAILDILKTKARKPRVTKGKPGRQRKNTTPTEPSAQ